MLIAAVVGIAIATCVTSVRTIDSGDRISSGRSTESRFVLWHEGLDTFSKHPVFGVGLGRLTLSVEGVVHGKRQMLQIGGPKNEFIFVMAEDGLLGVSMLVIFLVFAVCGLIRNSGVFEKSLAAAWISWSICGLTDVVYGSGDWSLTPVNAIAGMLIGATLMNSFTGDVSVGRACSFGERNLPIRSNRRREGVDEILPFNGCTACGRSTRTM
jgi:hypothetical protein